LKATQILHERGQSLWLDNITRGLLDSGQIQHSIDNYAVTGLTSSGRPPGAARAPAGPVLRRGPGAATAQPDPAAPAARRGSDLHLLARRPGGGDVATEIPVSVDFRTALGAAEQPMSGSWPTRWPATHHPCQPDVSASPGISWQATAAGTARGRRGHDQGGRCPAFRARDRRAGEAATRSSVEHGTRAGDRSGCRVPGHPGGRILWRARRGRR
jgi:hypothetical protein